MTLPLGFGLKGSLGSKELDHEHAARVPSRIFQSNRLTFWMWICGRLGSKEKRPTSSVRWSSISSCSQENLVHFSTCRGWEWPGWL